MSTFQETISSNLSSGTANWYYVHPDQLNPAALFETLPDEIRGNMGLLFIESTARWTRLPFHKKRIVFEISAMRHLAITCMQKGIPVHYAVTDEPFERYLNRLLHNGKAPEPGYADTRNLPHCSTSPLTLHAMRPASLDERNALDSLTQDKPDKVTLHPNTFFLADSDVYRSKIGPGYRMEFFYRDMRKKLDLLMEHGSQPAGGEWNYDKDNRKSLPKKITLPAFPEVKADAITEEVVEKVRVQYPNHFGELEPFTMAVTTDDAQVLTDHFFEHCLASFGPYEDAMAKGEAFVFHSSLSAYMNVGLLAPLDLCRRAEMAWKNGDAPLNSVEGFIRQIIGWREFVRVYYEAMMPEVRQANALKFDRGLPEVFWTADSGMACMDDIVGGVKKWAWSHHIPRLMVLSNFSNLTETDPYQLYLWFWYGYSDAHDWVVLPNVLGMSTFADGGVLASKPYVSGGNYINKMSNYCGSCRYKIKEKTGEEACPFNYLYWNFVDNHRDLFNENGRVSFMVTMFDKRSEEERQAIKTSAQRFIDNLPRWQEVRLDPAMESPRQAGEA